MSNMKLRTVFFTSLVVIALVGCGKKSKTAAKAPLDIYPTMVISKDSATLQTEYPVTIKGKEDVEIRARIDGFIDAIYVDEGAVVRKGQALFKINSPQAEQALTSAQAAIFSAEAQLNTASLNVERIRPLVEKDILSPIQLKTYENAYQSALASLNQARATLKNAQATMGWTTVTSPVAGVVGSLSFRVGSLVNSTNTLTTVASTDNVFAYFSLNESELRAFLAKTPGANQAQKIKNTPSVTLKLSDDFIYPQTGRIETISGIINVSTGSASFRAEFPNKEGVLRSGFSGKVIIPELISDAIVIPQRATFTQQDKTLIYKVEGDSVVVQTIILVKPMPDGKTYIVTGGLVEGDKVVTDGIATLTNGKKIAVK